MHPPGREPSMEDILASIKKVIAEEKELRTSSEPIESVEKINIGATQRLTYRGSMLTRDENIVDVDIVVQFRRTDPKEFLFNMLDPEEPSAEMYAEFFLVAKSALGDAVPCLRRLVENAVKPCVAGCARIFRHG